MNNEHAQPETIASDDSRAISRKTVLRGAAWAVPVIAVAVSAPIAAASGELLIEFYDQTERDEEGVFMALFTVASGGQPFTGAFTAEVVTGYPEVSFESDTTGVNYFSGEAEEGIGILFLSSAAAGLPYAVRITVGQSSSDFSASTPEAS